MKNDFLLQKLNMMFPNPKCELNYNKDYELLVAVMLSAQCTDKRVNIVTASFFNKYNLKDICTLSIYEIEKHIISLGSYHKKAIYLKEICLRLLNDYNGVVPCNRNYLESLPGVGRKTCNVVLSELFDIPTIAVDTHVERVSKRLGLVNINDNVVSIEKTLMKKFESKDYNRVNHQLLLLGRYICKAKSPNCCNCMLNDYCKHKKNKE